MVFPPEGTWGQRYGNLWNTQIPQAIHTNLNFSIADPFHLDTDPNLHSRFLG